MHRVPEEPMETYSLYDTVWRTRHEGPRGLPPENKRVLRKDGNSGRARTPPRSSIRYGEAPGRACRCAHLSEGNIGAVPERPLALCV